VSTYGFALDEPFALVAPMGVDLERYEGLPEPTEARKRLELPEKLTVGYTGHLYAGRGVDLLFQLAGGFPEAQFVLAGGEPDAVRRWEARRLAWGLQNVRLLGFVPNRELPMVQAACEILAMPYARRVLSSSGTETGRFASPMKTFEYLASGRAILSSDLPVLREVLSDENAVLVPSEDLSAWQGALRDLIRSPDRRSALAAQARREVERYTWRARARRVLEGFVD
jgi:glycosyltransferase involved in cell wall biosynthesis